MPIILGRVLNSHHEWYLHKVRLIRCLKMALGLVVMILASSRATEGSDDASKPSGSSDSGPRVVLLWPEEAHTFLNGLGIIAALVTTNFDTPREGSIELLLNGNNAANFTPEAMDGEGNRRLHVVLPELSDGTFSVEVRCISIDGVLLARDGSTFTVNSTAPVRSSSATTLEQAKLCHDVGFCDSDSECNGHGKCSRGACLCHGDWVGETCEHDIYHNPSFLPDSDPGRSPSLCHRSSEWEEAAKHVHDRLLALHALHHCAVTPYPAGPSPALLACPALAMHPCPLESPQLHSFPCSLPCTDICTLWGRGTTLSWVDAIGVRQDEYRL